MIPGEIQVEEGEIEINQGRETITLEVANSGDRPVQVGSHYHFYETNSGLVFERESARGYRLDIPAYENEELLAKIRELKAEWDPKLREAMDEIAARGR